MTGQDLKNSILQLAIQGKLVPQDANDEPASVLLERIKAEKQKLINEKKIKKEKPLPEITDEEKPFEIPESWEWCKLGEILDVRDGTHDSPNYIEKGYPLITSKDFDGDHFNFSKTKFISEEDYLKIIERSKVDVGDILYSMIGGNIGNNILITEDNYFDMAIKNVALFKQFSNGILYQKYILAFLNSQIKAIQLLATGGAQAFVPLKTFRQYTIPLPPLSEQHRIVAKIEELMPLVEEYDKAQKELDALNAKLPEALKKSILQEAIQGKLVPQDPNDEPASILLQRIRKEKEQLVKDGKLKKKDLLTTPISDEEKLFEIPESWEWCRLGEIFSHNNGKQLNRADTQGDYHDYITTSNLYWDKFDFKEVRQMLFTKEELVKCTATKGDLLVCEGGDVGRSAIWDFDYDICIQNHIHRLRAYLPLCTRFFLYLLMFNKSIGVIGGKGIGIQGLSAKVLHNILFPLPPLAEQHRIVSKIEDLFAQIEPLAKALSTPM